MSNAISNVISGVFCFAKVTEPALKYESENEYEFSIQIVVDEDTYDTFGETYSKQKGKAVKTSEFENIFKIKPPYPNAKKQFILKLAKGATYKSKENGQIVMVEKKYWPSVLVQDGKKAVKLDEGILIANGSVGKVSFEENTNSYGTFAKLKNILVEELIEYKKDKDDAAADFGFQTEEKGSKDFEVKEDKPVNDKVVSVKPKPAPKKVVTEIEETDCPF